jgi:hypothetical protein
MTQCPTNLCFVFDNPRETLRSGSVWFTTMVRSSMVFPTSGLFLLTLSQFALPGTPEDKFWDSFFDVVQGPCARSFEALKDVHDFHTAYGIPPGGGIHRSGKGVPHRNHSLDWKKSLPERPFRSPGLPLLLFQLLLALMPHGALGGIFIMTLTGCN